SEYEIFFQLHSVAIKKGKGPKKLILARDIFGVRSMYYYKTEQALFFASEMKCFLAIKDFKPKVNLNALYYYLSGGYAPDRDTLLTGVYKVLPAEIVRFEEGKLDRRKYWTPLAADSGPQDPDYWARALWENLQNSTREMLPPGESAVGIALSGGLDSSLIAAAMRHVAGTRQLIGFTLDNANRNELEMTKQVAKRLDINLIIVKIDSDIFQEDLQKLQWLYDELIIKFTFIPTYYLVKAAQKHVEFLFTGDGGDELFMGYRSDYWEDPFIIKSFSKLGFIRKPLLKIGERIVRPIARRSTAEILSLATEFFTRAYASHPDWQYRIASRIFEAYLHEEELHRLFPQSNIPNITEEMVKTINQTAPQNVIEKISHTLIAGHLQDDLLRLEKSTAATGVKTRSPLLDPKLLQFILNIPPGLKYRNKTTKYLIRYMSEKYDLLPNSLIHPKRKIGLNAPIRRWLNESSSQEYFRKLMKINAPLPPINMAYANGFYPPKTYVQALKSWNIAAISLWTKVFMGKE
ncbi:asparagine synthetase B family protein, partial [Chloroflexota bacterium]